MVSLSSSPGRCGGGTGLPVRVKLLVVTRSGHWVSSPGHLGSRYTRHPGVCSQVCSTRSGSPGTHDVQVTLVTGGCRDTQHAAHPAATWRDDKAGWRQKAGVINLLAVAQ